MCFLLRHVKWLRSDSEKGEMAFQTEEMLLNQHNKCRLVKIPAKALYQENEDLKYVGVPSP